MLYGLLSTRRCSEKSDRIYWIQCIYVASQLLLTFMSADTGIYNNRPCVPRIDQQSGGSMWAVCASVWKSLMGVSRWSLSCHVCTCCVHTLKTISILELYLTKGCCCILCSVCDSSELILSAKQVKKKNGNNCLLTFSFLKNHWNTSNGFSLSCFVCSCLISDSSAVLWMCISEAVCSLCIQQICKLLWI